MLHGLGVIHALSVGGTGGAVNEEQGVKKYLLATGVAFFALAFAAHAIPSWMGVYGSYNRHDGNNPGTFTILMNNNYSGLKAEVGIKIGSGNWSVYQMTNAGTVSINSIWKYSPTVPFPVNTTVQYYFHGYDNSNGNIWDNNNGQNYSFTIPGPVSVQWLGNVSHWPPSGQIKPVDNFWINAESWPIGSGVEASIVFTTNNGVTWGGAKMSKAGIKNNNDWWNFNLGKNYGGTVIKYAVNVKDANSNSLWNSNGGQNYSASVIPGRSVLWVGSQTQWPDNGSITQDSKIWVNVDSWPTGAAFYARSLYSVNGGVWYMDPMNFAGIVGNNDWWHLNLEEFPPGSTIYYTTEVTDQNGAVKKSSDGTGRAWVNSSSGDSDSDGLPDDWEMYWWNNLSASRSSNPDRDGTAYIPLDNELEYMLGTEPTHSNRAASIALIWKPSIPVQQGVYRLSYDPDVNKILSGTGTKARVVSVPGGQASEYGPLVRNNVSGRFETNITVAAGATNLVVSFFEGNIVDDNRGVSWNIPVRLLIPGQQADSDRDGMPDAWEILYSLDPLDDGSIHPVNGPNGDPDGDGSGNLEELQAGRNPRFWDAYSISVTVPSVPVYWAPANTNGTSVTYPLPVVTGNCPDAIQVSTTPSSGSFFPVGVTTVSVQAADFCGNLVLTSFPITVASSTLRVTMPRMPHYWALSYINGLSINFPVPDVSNGCSNVVYTTMTPPPGSYFNVGETVVSMLATDACGNRVSASFKVNVAPYNVPSSSVNIKKSGAAVVKIVCPESLAAKGESLRAQLSSKLQANVSLVRDTDILETNSWQPGAAWPAENLIVLGNMSNNRLLFGLAGRLLGGANDVYPGAGRYILRTLQSPYRRGQDMILVDAADNNALDAGIQYLLSIIPGGTGDISISGGRIEIRNSAGAVNQNSLYTEMNNGNHLLFWDPQEFSTDFRTEASKMFFFGISSSRTAVKNAALLALASQPAGWLGYHMGNDHYRWKGHYVALMQALASGVFNEQERAEIDRRLTDNLLRAQGEDYTIINVRDRTPGTLISLLNRHHLATYAAFYVIAEYLHQVGTVEPAKKEEVEQIYLRMRAHMNAFLDTRIYRSVNNGPEGLDGQGILAGLYLHGGDDRLFSNNVLPNMANLYFSGIDNLGYNNGTDAYGSARPGMQFTPAWGGITALMSSSLLGSEDASWWITQRGDAYNPRDFLEARIPPAFMKINSILSNPSGLKPGPGLSMTRMDQYNYNRVSNPASYDYDTLTATTQTIERVYDTAVIRDGFSTNDAFIHLKGLNQMAVTGGEPLDANSIGRYTELGSILLYHNNARDSHWSRNTVSISQGWNRRQSAICEEVSSFSNPQLASGIRSFMPDQGSAAWTRSVIRRHSGYAVVIDNIDLSPANNVEFKTVCRWRSYHFGATNSSGAFMAEDYFNNVRLHIKPTDVFDQRAELEPKDGAAEPTVFYQEWASPVNGVRSHQYQNLIYAEGNGVSRTLDIRRAGAKSVMVDGTLSGVPETAAIGLDSFNISSMMYGTAALWYVSDAGAVASGVISNFMLYGLEVQITGSLDVDLSLTNGIGLIANRGTQPASIKVLRALTSPWQISNSTVNIGTTWSVAPGQQLALRYGGTVSALKTTMRTQLLGAWNGLPVRSFKGGGIAQPVLPALQESWSVNAFSPQPGPVPDIKAWDPDGRLTEKSSFRLVDRSVNFEGRRSGVVFPVSPGRLDMDLGRLLPVDGVRIIGATERLAAYHGKRMRVKVDISETGQPNDFQNIYDRDVDFSTHFVERAQYTYTVQYPAHKMMFDTPVNARFLRVAISWADAGPTDLYIHEIEPLSSAFARRDEIRFVYMNNVMAAGRSAVMAWCRQGVVLYSTAGQELWRVTPAAPVAEAMASDIDGDNVADVVVYTLDDRLTVYSSTGTVTSRDLRGGQINNMISGRPAFLSAWKKDANGRKEIMSFPHYALGNFEAADNLKYVEQQFAYSSRAGVSIPDVDGDGRDDLALIAGYGGYFTVLKSSSSVPAKLLYVTSVHGMRGHWGGNFEEPLCYEGSYVTNNIGERFVLSVTPGNVSVFNATNIAYVYSGFYHPANLSHSLVQQNGQTKAVISREDTSLSMHNFNPMQKELNGFLPASALDLAFGPRSGKVVAATHRGTYLVNANNFIPEALHGIKSHAVCAVPDPDGVSDLFITAGDDGKIRGLK